MQQPDKDLLSENGLYDKLNCGEKQECQLR